MVAAAALQVFAGDVVPKKKPAPDVYLLAAKASALHCTVLWYAALRCTVLPFAMLGLARAVMGSAQAYGSVVWCGVVWCGVVWCGVVWCGVVWCGVLCCGAVVRGWLVPGSVELWWAPMVTSSSACVCMSHLP